MIILVALLLLLPLVAADISSEQIREIESTIENDEVLPSFTNIKSVIYYTPDRQDYDDWSTGKGEEFDASVRGWCFIPFEERGFFEDVMCQEIGGFSNRGVYSLRSISDVEQESSVEADFDKGVTSTRTDPAAKFTISVNDDPNSNCHIPINSYVYIYWGDGNDWNGIYKAEDSGANYRGSCEIGVYTGVGRTSYESALDDRINNMFPSIYLLDENANVVGASARSGSVMGMLRGDYSFTHVIRGLRLFYNDIFDFVDDLHASCNDDYDNCVQEVLERNRNVSISRSCPLSDYNLGNLSTNDDFLVVTGELIDFIEGSGGERAYFNNSYYDEVFIVDFERDVELIYDNGVALEFLNVSDVEEVIEGGVQTGTQTLDIVPNRFNQFKAGEYTNASYRIEYLLGDVARQIKDCSTSIGNCSCNITLPGYMDTLEFNNSMISFKGVSIDTNTSIKLNTITGITNFPFHIAESRVEELLVKNNTVYMREAQINKSACQPTKNHYLFCASNNHVIDNKDIYKNKVDFWERAKSFRINFAFIFN